MAMIARTVNSLQQGADLPPRPEGLGRGPFLVAEKNSLDARPIKQCIPLRSLEIPVAAF